MRHTFALQSFFFAFTFAVPTDPSVSTTASAPAAQSTACGDLVNSCSACYPFVSLNLTYASLDTIFTAKQVYDCFITVPFNPAVATRFLQYYNDTLQFHTTLSYLKNPPSSYQQPAVDLLGGLDQIQKDINRGAFSNQYSFEATLQNLVYSARDSHLQLQSGILSPFKFASPYSIVSLSEDGVKDPKVYVLDDALFSGSNSTSKPSPIKSINGRDVTDFLVEFGAANSYGLVEPHADWNNLMSSSATYIQNEFSIFEDYATFYPGETITIAFENGTQLDPTPWLAYYDSPGPTGPLATGGDFYNFFVLGFYPASFDESAPDPCAASDNSSDATIATNTSSSNAIPTPTSWPDTAYPSTADVFQPNLYPFGGGFVTGYFLKDISLAVLSIPTFSMLENDTQTFSDTVGQFLNRSHAAGLKHILIDLQANLGGDTLLAVDTFKHFFPSNDTFRGSRLRAHPMADVLGNTFTNYFTSNQAPSSEIYGAVAANAWVATDRLNAATNQNFTSWGELFGPHTYNGDSFTTVQRENISSAVFDEFALGIDIFGAVEPADQPQFYNPEDIVILTDGLCSSACAVFVEMMHHETGVRTVVAGGLPRSGPMQAASGSRGAQTYSSISIDRDIEVAQSINETAKDYLPDRTEDVLLDFMTINLRDQIRKDQDIPVQFQYDAADCRIYYTAETLSDYSKLWTYAANAIFSDSKLCVPGSTGYSSTNPGGASVPPQDLLPAKYNTSKLLGTSNDFTDDFTNIQQGSAVPLPIQGKKATAPQTCDTHTNRCPNNRRCIPTPNQPPKNQQFGGRTVSVFSGTCPTIAASGGGLNSLTTKQDEPGEIRGGVVNSKKRGVRFGIIAKVRRWFEF
ncbi:MAG: hypothetical protein M1836_008211 [Candelina mexicana]|nr:MAG: hypothetical protein M1836_008211 [Candelina mexicana]